MRNIILLYIALIMASASGCSRHGAVDAILDRADSLIAIATAYYADRPDSPELMRSLFYQATVYYNAERYGRAAVDATHAYEIAVKLDDPFWTGKTSDKIADIFNKTYNYDECIKFRKIAVTSYAKIRKRNFYQWALLELSNDYINSGNLRNDQSLIP